MSNKKLATAASSPKPWRGRDFSSFYALAKQINERKKSLHQLRINKTLTPAMLKMIKKLKKPRA